MMPLKMSRVLPTYQMPMPQRFRLFHSIGF